MRYVATTLAIILTFAVCTACINSVLRMFEKH